MFPMPPWPRLFPFLALVLLSAIAPAQTGRSLTIDQALEPGRTSVVTLDAGTLSAGNAGYFALTMPFAGTMPLSPPPGWTFVGQARVDLTQILLLVPFVLDANGRTTLVLPLPNDPAYLGLRVDLQTIDFEATTQTGYWSDTDLELLVERPGCGAAQSFDPLYPPGIQKEPAVVQDTPTARITRIADRARDRHARESQFQQYDHWLTFYWEQRIAEITFIDEIARGGNRILVQFMTHDRLNPAEFRAFYSGNPTVAVYHLNLSTAPGTGVNLAFTRPSTRYPGETEHHYEVVLQTKFPEQRPLRLGDRIEIELSQFLAAPRNGRSNYYGTALLYVVGEGVVPWYARQKEEAPTPQLRQAASFDSYRLPDHAWLGGATTLNYPYSDEPIHRFKQTATNLSHQSGHEFVLGRRLHHTDFGSGAHSEPGNPAFIEHAGKLGPKFIEQSCVACHTNNGRALPPAPGNALKGFVVHLGRNALGEPDLTLGDTLQPSVGSASPGTVNATIEAESYAVANGVQIEPTLDLGGGSNVTSIDTGDWMSFHTQPVTIPTAGTYELSFRVASAQNGGRLALEESGGAVQYALIDVPNTGGPQVWTTVTLSAFLPAGSRAFGLNARTGGFNLNRFGVASLQTSGGTPPTGGEARVFLDGHDVIPGQYADGTAYELRRPRYRFDGATPAFYSVRAAAPLIGLGLLEAIDESTLLTRHDPCDLDQDGISGRLSFTTEFGSGRNVIGRFGWKGTRASVKDQVARALNRDMGVTTALQPVLDGATAPAQNPELDLTALDRMARYTALLGVAARRDLLDPAALRGEQIFRTIRCDACHVPELVTGSGHPYGELRDQVIRPFTDLLLHDMGPGLADPMAEGDARGAEWRTPPLWNIGLTAGVSGGEAYLHDGRARSLAEAILWHGGEGEAAKEAFRQLSASARADLIAFLRSL